MERLLNKEVKLNEMSPLTLAFVGDGVFDLFVREYIVCKGNCPVKKLHSKAVSIVRCESQSKLLTEHIIPVLTVDEIDVCKRGRNAHVNHIPKNSKVADYHNATALECLFGYLYLKGELDRLRELFDIVVRVYSEI